MLHIDIKGREFYDDKTNEFHYVDDFSMDLEHSLYSISKWEGKYHKPFFDTMEKRLSLDETLDYIQIMCADKKVSKETLYALTKQQLEQIIEYIEDPMTATTFQDNAKNAGHGISGGRKHEIITAEIIYYWMVELGIPFECEHWHINKLMALIKVCSIKNADQTGKNKMNKKDSMAFNRALMASRRAKKGGH